MRIERVLIYRMMIGLAGLLWLMGSAVAESERLLLDEPDADSAYQGAERSWQEEAVTLPPLPETDDLIAFKVDEPVKRFRYYIDAASLSLGGDEVLRFSLVIESRKGARNVSYEGLRCSAKQYKVYAYGDGRGQFHAVRRPAWQRINDTSPYRQQLLRNYLCDQQGMYVRPLEPAVIIQNLQRQ